MPQLIYELCRLNDNDIVEGKRATALSPSKLMTLDYKSIPSGKIIADVLSILFLKLPFIQLSNLLT